MLLSVIDNVIALRKTFFPDDERHISQSGIYLSKGIHAEEIKRKQ